MALEGGSHSWRNVKIGTARKGKNQSFSRANGSWEEETDRVACHSLLLSLSLSSSLDDVLQWRVDDASKFSCPDDEMEFYGSEGRRCSDLVLLPATYLLKIKLDWIGGNLGHE